MTAVTDRWGTLAPFGYDASNRLTKVYDPADITRFIRLRYTSGRLDSIVDPYGRGTDVTVNSSRRLTSIRDPDSVATTFGYAAFRMVTITDRRAVRVAKFLYDTASLLLVSDTGPSIPVYPSGTARPVVRYAPWQVLGVPYGATSPTTLFTPPRADTVRGTVTDPGGHSVRFTVNGFGQPLVTTDALGNATTVVYTSAGLPTSVSYPGGATATTIYTADGLPSYVQPAGRTATSFHYAVGGKWGVPDSTKGTGQPTVINHIGENGRIDSVSVAGDTTRYTYDSRGRVASRTDPGGHVVTAAYDGVNGNRGRVTVPGTWYYQDGMGRDTAVHAPEGAPQRVVYDVLNRVVEQYDSVGASPTRSWWGTLWLDSLADPLNQRYRFAYNALGLVSRRTDPAGAVDSTRYDVEWSSPDSVDR